MQNKPPRAGLHGTAERGWNSFLDRNKHSTPSASPQAAGLRSIGSTAAETVADLQFRRQVERLHRLGARTLAELLIELGEQRLCRTYLEQRIRRYADIDPEHLAALGGGGFPRPPLYEVRR